MANPKVKEIIISLDVTTDKSYEEVTKALRKGVFTALDTEPNYIAAPKDVKVNYCCQR